MDEVLLNVSELTVCFLFHLNTNTERLLIGWLLVSCRDALRGTLTANPVTARYEPATERYSSPGM